MEEERDTLLYFAARGRAEPIRMLYALAGEPLIDQRISDFGQWKSQFKAEQPLGQLPVLTCKEGTLVLSSAIAKYAAKKFDLVGGSLWEESLSDMVMAACIDLHNDIGQKIYHWKVFKFFPEPPNSTRIIQEIRDKLVLSMKHIQSIAEQQGKWFIVCDQITLADVYTYCILEYSTAQYPEMLALNPWIKQFVSRFCDDERIQRYLARRPDSSYGV